MAGGRIALRTLAAVGLGNALEFYDFLTFSFFAVQIGHCFVPAGNEAAGLLAALATFGVGFATRPLGGFVIGRFGDRAGRRPAMLLSFALMGAGMLGLAVTPSYAAIGPAAPVLVVCFRLVQGFALGGEVGPSTAFLIETAPPGRRGVYVALQYATQQVAVLTAGLVAVALSATLAPAALDAWGWRIAFLLGLAVVPVGLAIRRSLPETLHRRDPDPTAASGPIPVRLVALGLAMLISATVCTYVVGYMATFAQDSLHLAPGTGFGAIVTAGLCSLIGAPVAGLLSDRFGRKPVMLSAGTLLFVIAVPLFMLLLRAPEAATLWGVTAVLSVLTSVSGTPALVALTEALPQASRSRALGTIYAVAIASFGGTTQYVIKRLIVETGSALAPACYMTGALALGLVAMTMMRETAPGRAGVLAASASLFRPTTERP
jgi:MFS family permease